MSDMIDMYRDMKEHRRELRAALGMPCPNCRSKQPRREPTILLPQQRCKVDGYRDPRPEMLVREWNARLNHEAGGATPATKQEQANG